MASSHLPPHPTEATPLLVDTHGDSDIAEQPSERRDEGEPTTEPAGPSHGQPPSRVNRVIYFMSWAMTALSCLQVVFLGILFAMNSYGSSHFGDSDWTFHYDGASYAFLGVLIGLFSAFNALWIKTKGKPTATLLSILIYGSNAFVVFLFVGDQISRRIYWSGLSCNKSLDDPKSQYPGSYTECLHWETKYIVAVWFFLVLDAVVVCLSIAIVVAHFVKLYKERGQRSPNGAFSINIPAGQVSLNVSLQWGPLRENDEQVRGIEA
ncbi:unnamed protein product [Clonostachys rhizophaga]|uniref:Uncharacterized protein n=1 Tax=Clonostachys rhizophaga TaxID=160324 RepID=A0A9N9VPG3_9HYPO|nr:unnamed protein product [Clonostachys rhizophaga]